MNAPGLFDRLDDLINPIVVKELRQAVKSRLVVAVLLLFLGLQVLILGMFLMVGEARTGPDAVDWHAGQQIFPVLEAILLGTCMLLIPAYAAVRLGAERNDSNVDLLFISALRPTSIVWGKFAAAAVLGLLVFSACAPFMTFTYLMRGLDIPSILLVLGIDVLAMLFGTQLALFVAAVPAHRAVKVVVCLLGFLLLAMLFGTLVRVCAGLVQFGTGGMEEPWEFWGWVGAAVLMTLSAVGILFCWTVALISPPASNRAPAGRIFLVLQWAATGVVAGLLSYRVQGLTGVGHHGPFAAWVALSVVLGCVQFLISINERDHWGQRVARAIPRRRWLRPAAFLVYSGAAGGVTLAAAMTGLTLLAGELWRRWYPGFSGVAESEHVSRVMVVLLLYTYSYAMSGVFLRSLLGDRVPVAFTWLLGLLLAGLGSSLPTLFAYMTMTDAERFTAINPWWMVPNPFAAVYEAMNQGSRRSHSSDLVISCFWFSGTWAVLATLACVPWYLGQVLRFHPPAPAAAPVVVPVTANGEAAALPAPAASVEAPEQAEVLAGEGPRPPDERIEVQPAEG